MIPSLVMVTLLGERHSVSLPGFAEREELINEWASVETNGPLASLRLAAAAIGLCTRVGRRVKASYTKMGCSPLAYGGEVYGFLRESGATPEEIGEAGVICLKELRAALAPREPDVAAREAFTGAGEGPSTPPLSGSGSNTQATPGGSTG